jgi:hypothetical protein
MDIPALVLFYTVINLLIPTLDATLIAYDQMCALCV